VIHFDVVSINKKISDLEEEASKQDFWLDLNRSQEVLKKSKVLKNSLDRYNNLTNLVEDLYTLIILGIEEADESVIDEVKSEYDKLKNLFLEFKIEAMFNEQYDKNNAILTLHSGAGGTEAQDWVQMLYRMYTRWAERHNFEIKVLDFLAGDEAGIKSVTILISGDSAYGYMKSEKGVHRLVRISPFDSSGRRHTSFASLDVMPEIAESIEIDINPSDLRIDTYRASGAGGQHVNKTDSAVRITHIPTGVVVACQNERSQFQNKDTAMKMLKMKLLQIMEQEQKEKIEDLKGLQMDIGWGSQIRSYVFCPYTMVKDHRTNYETGNVNAVMDGEIDEFISSYLLNKAKSKK